MTPARERPRLYTGDPQDVGDTHTRVKPGIRYVTGVGSRETPPEALAALSRIFDRLVRAGIVLRTGGAYGADNACLFGALGANLVDGLDNWPKRLPFPTETDVRAVVYLPWVDHAPNSLLGEMRAHPHVRFRRVYDDRYAELIVDTLHPAARRLPPTVRLLHTRNVHAVLGDHNMPLSSDLVICWTRDGAGTDGIPTTRDTGGTGMAIRIAETYGIPVINLARACEKAGDWRLVEDMAVGVALALRDRPKRGAHVYPMNARLP